MDLLFVLCCKALLQHLLMHFLNCLKSWNKTCVTLYDSNPINLLRLACLITNCLQHFCLVLFLICIVRKWYKIKVILKKGTWVSPSSLVWLYCDHLWVISKTAHKWLPRNPCSCQMSFHTKGRWPATVLWRTQVMLGTHTQWSELPQSKEKVKLF